MGQNEVNKMGHQHVQICGRRIDGMCWPIKTDSGGALDVFLQDQNTQANSFYIKQAQNTVTLAENFTVNTTQANFVAGHNFVVGNMVSMIENGVPYQAEVLGVVGNAITFDTPAPITYSVNARSTRAVRNLTVNGSLASPQIFNINPIQGAIWDVTKITFLLQDGSEMDTGKFGGIAKLTNGIVFRKKVSDQEYHNYFNIKTNGDFEVNNGLVDYVSKAPAGQYGFISKHTFGGQSNFGVVIRLNGTKLEELQILVQDDLTGLINFNVTVNLHEVLQ